GGTPWPDASSPSAQSSLHPAPSASARPISQIAAFSPAPPGTACGWRDRRREWLCTLPPARHPGSPGEMKRTYQPKKRKRARPAARELAQGGGEGGLEDALKRLLAEAGLTRGVAT